MAETLELRRDTTTIDLLDGDPGWSVVDPGWMPKVCEYVEGRLPPPVVEVLKISGVGFASQDALATAEIALNKMAVAASRYIGDRTEEHPVWLYDQLNAETGQRRALVRKMRVEKLTQQHGVDCEGLILDAEPVFILTIEREPYWERTAERNFPTATPAAAAAVVYDYTATADIVGDAPARISQFNIRTPSAAKWAMDRLWIGLRSANKHGTLANFKPIWECEDGTNIIGNGASDVVDATASGGSKVQVASGHGTWAQRMSLTMSEITVNEEENFGDFLWLLRTKVSSGTYYVQLKFGYLTTTENLIEGPIIKVSNTAWDYKGNGTQIIPIRMVGLDLVEADHRFQVEIWTKQTSGAGTLDLDCLLPLPIDEGFLYSDTMGLSGDIQSYWHFTEGSKPQMQALTQYPYGTWSSFPTLDIKNFRLPVGDGRMIIVYARASDSVITDAIEINQDSTQRSYYERWHTLRGSE